MIPVNENWRRVMPTLSAVRGHLSGLETREITSTGSFRNSGQRLKYEQAQGALT